MARDPTKEGQHALARVQFRAETRAADERLLSAVVQAIQEHQSGEKSVPVAPKALRKAVRQVFGESFPVQRCVRHKERNALKYLPKSDHPEFRRRWKLIHGMARYSDAKQQLESLVHWLRQRNLDAAASVEEAEGETLTVIELKASAALRRTLLSTNPIESGFDKVRAKTNRVRRWRKKGDQIQRWAAASLLAVEKGFRAIRGAKDLPAFVAEIRRKNLPAQAEAA